ncbi:MAG TPA: PilZ domain-containing protein [Acidobacteriaceae bacterium]|nr:PilZ domain-containing protein [Acidobacteriaceae bacterium]
MSDAATKAERRTAQRYGCAGDAEIVLPGRGLRFAGKIGNLSAGGCFIEAHCVLERGTAVEVWMNADGQPLRVAANLMVRRSTGVGLRFLGLTERKTEQIRSLIAELAAEERGLQAGNDEGKAAEPQADAPPEMFSRHLHEATSVRRVNWLVRLARRLRIRKRRR